MSLSLQGKTLTLTPKEPGTGDQPEIRAGIEPTETSVGDSIVYLVQEPTIPKHTGRIIDTAPLLWWGAVVVIMERTQSASFRPAQALAQITQRLANFRPDRDYIAVAGGDTLAVLLVGAALANYGHTQFNYLRFERARNPDGTRDPANGGYVPIPVPLSITG